MLCGAGDCSIVLQAFDEVVKNFGGIAINYQTGNIIYENNAASDFRDNSSMTVKNADLCVFVIIHDIGEITWSTELDTALSEGKPFLILCSSTFYQDYLSIKKHINQPDILKEQSLKIFNLMLDLEKRRNLTAVQFEITNFKEVLRQQLAIMFSIALRRLEINNREAGVISKLINRSFISNDEKKYLIDIAIDEFAEKQIRKRIIIYLCNEGVDIDTLRLFMESSEQGIQRLAFQMMGSLYKDRPFPVELIECAINICNDSLDTGLVRRCIESLFAIDVAMGIEALMNLNINEIGVKRRIAQCLIQNKERIINDSLNSKAVSLAKKCSKSGDVDGWLKKINDFINEFENR